MAILLQEYTYKCCCLFSINNKRVTFYQKTRHGAAITVWYFTFVKKKDPKHIWKMNPREHIIKPQYLFFHFSVFYMRNCLINIRHERGKALEVFTTSRTYPWLFMTQILHISQPSRGCGRNTFEVMTNVHPPNRFEHRTKIIVWLSLSPRKRRNDTNNLTTGYCLKEINHDSYFPRF